MSQYSQLLQYYRDNEKIYSNNVYLNKVYNNETHHERVN